MKTLVAILLMLCVASMAFARGGSDGTQHVNSYTRKDGTHVRAYVRRGPTGGSDSGSSSGGYNTGEPTNPYVDAQGWGRDIDTSAATYPGLRRGDGPGVVHTDSPPTYTAPRSPAYSTPHVRHTYQIRQRFRSRNDTQGGGIERDARGRIKRSESAKREFQLRNPCPATGRSTGSCPGYVIDHITALKRGGPDTPENMQWQTVEQAKEKDRWE